MRCEIKSLNITGTTLKFREVGVILLCCLWTKCNTKCAVMCIIYTADETVRFWRRRLRWPCGTFLAVWSGTSRPSAWLLTVQFLLLSNRNLNTRDFRYTRFRISAVLFQYHQDLRFRIRGHATSCRWGPLRCARSFTDSPRHFASGDYKLTPLMMSHGKVVFPVLRVFDKSGYSNNRVPAYNENHLYTFQAVVGPHTTRKQKSCVF
jgi:hypothetical protein